MAKQHLHGAQVRAALEQVGGKGMSERVRRNGAANARLKCVFFNHFPHVLARQSTARAVDEKLVASGRKKGSACADIVCQHLLHHVVQGHQPFFGTLAENAYKAALQVKIRHTHGAQLRNTQACGVQKFKHATVAFAAFVAQVWLGKQGFHFIPCQHLWQVLGQLGIFQQFSRVFTQPAFINGKSKKCPQGGKAACQGAPRVLPRAQPGKVQKNLLLIGVGQGFFRRALSQLLPVQKKTLKILPVGFNRIGRKAALGQQKIPPQG